MNKTEILAIAKACELLGSRIELVNRSVTISSDCKVAVDWVKNRGMGGVNHVRILSYICDSLDEFGQVSVVFCPRTENLFADALAKKGAGGFEEVRWSV